jgi:hypothetical protein
MRSPLNWRRGSWSAMALNDEKETKEVYNSIILILPVVILDLP